MNAPADPAEFERARRRQLLANGYEAIPICGKAPRWKKWADGEITDARLAEIEDAHADHTNTGIRTGRCVAVDIDLTNDAHAIEIEKILASALGESAFRRVGSKGALLCYFNADPIAKITVSGGGKRLIEFLGVGQQFAAYGVHPDTHKEYEWPEGYLGAEPTQTRLNDLPHVSPDALRSAAAQVAERLRQLGYSKVAVTGIEYHAEPREPSIASGIPVTGKIVEAMLSCIEPECDRGGWLTVCGGLRSAPVRDADFDGLELFKRWSRGDLHAGVPPQNFVSDEDCENEWQRDGNKSADGGSVPAFGALVNLARASGYAGPSQFISAAEAFGPAIEKLTAAEEPEPASNAIVLRNEATQNARKPPRWLIEGFLPDAGTVALHAPFNSFKSFTATDALMSVASGLAFFGKLAVKRPGPAIYVTGEGLSGFETLRRPAWRIARGIPADRALPIYTVDGVPQVRSDEDIARYVEAIAALKQRPSLIVIDPVARAMVGLKENDASDAAVYLNCVEQLARTFRCCVLSILHEGKDATRDIRGSSAFAAGFDAVWKQEADTEALTAIIRPIKLKDDAGVDALCIKARQIAAPCTGKSSLVFDLVPANEVHSASRGGVQRSEIGRALIALNAVNGKTVATRVLAYEIAGSDADENVVLAKDKNLRRYAKDRFRVYVAHLGDGRGDATLWTLPPPDAGGNAHV